MNGVLTFLRAVQCLLPIPSIENCYNRASPSILE
jgi:hypothetical protein